MLNRGVHPIIPEKGSVGASGDLAPLAHLASALMGEGECLLRGERLDSAEALRRAGLAPVRLEAKEGLALLNGTQAMHAVGGLALQRAIRLTSIADVASAMSLEALMGTPVAFDLRIARRPAAPRPKALRRAYAFFAAGKRDSRVASARRPAHPGRLQFALYSAGAWRRRVVRWAIAKRSSSLSRHRRRTIRSSFETGDVISGGNFHGAPLALALDYAALAVTDLMGISERRTDRLLNPDKSDGLPPFLAQRPGVQSGFMIAHVAMAALLNEARVLSHPASVDNVSTSAGKEDHVSMGMTSALKLRTIVDSAENLLAIEILSAGEGIEHRRPLRAGSGVERAFATLREIAPRLTNDRALYHDINRVAAAIRAGDFDSEFESS